MTKNTKAFTLIELLIVIVIIGILAVALIPRLTGAQATARDTARKATLQQAATVLSSYYSQESAPTATPATITPLTGVTYTNIANYGNLPTKDPQGKGLYVVNGATSSIILCTDTEKAGQGNSSAADCATAMATTASAEAALTGAVSTTSKAYLIKSSY